VAQVGQSQQRQSQDPMPIHRIRRRDETDAARVVLEARVI
jgi:hypothetical protein